MRFTAYWPAGSLERFDPRAFTGNVGKVVPVRMDNDTICGGTIVAAVVDGDGSGVTLTLEVSPPEGVQPESARYDELFR
jgi:hypothetical protein